MIHALLDFLHTLTDPESLIQLLSTALTGWIGYLVLFCIVFAESGLLVGFFLPGDSLLFTVGVVCGAGKLNVGAIIVLLIVASISGDGIGFLLGRRIGPAIFSRPDSRFLKQQYLQQTRTFYEKHGGKTIIYAKFIPIIRTFAAFIAGVAQMPYPRFLSFNVFGAIGWVFSMVMLGYTLGEIPFVRRHFEKIVLLIIFVSVLPVIVQIIHARKAKSAA